MSQCKKYVLLQPLPLFMKNPPVIHTLLAFLSYVFTVSLLLSYAFMI